MGFRNPLQTLDQLAGVDVDLVGSFATAPSGPRAELRQLAGTGSLRFIAANGNASALSGSDAPTEDSRQRRVFVTTDDDGFGAALLQLLQTDPSPLVPNGESVAELQANQVFISGTADGPGPSTLYLNIERILNANGTQLDLTTDVDWTPFTVAAGFTAALSTTPAIRRVGRLVQLQGAVQATSGTIAAAGATVATGFSAGFRPKTGTTWRGLGARSDGTACRVNLTDTGQLQVNVQAPSVTSWVSLDSTIFLV